MKIFNHFAFGLLIFIVGAGAVYASSFQVTPIQVKLSTAQPVTALTVKSSGNEATVIQAEVMAWSQQQGKDVYTPSQDIIVSPPIVTIPAGGSQIVRIGLKRTPDAQRELTYRVYLQEVPPPPKPGFQGLQMAMRMGIPVYVAPAATAQAPALVWRVYRTKDGKLEVALQNNGSTHVKVIDFSLVDANGSKLGVQPITASVLAGQSDNWQVKAINVPSSTSSVHLFAQTDGGEIDVGVLTVESK